MVGIRDIIACEAYKLHILGAKSAENDTFLGHAAPKYKNKCAILESIGGEKFNLNDK